VALSIGLLLAGAPSRLGAQAEPVVFYDFAAMTGTPYGPYPETKAVVTATSSFIVATIPPGYRQTPHRHNQEQFTLGFSGQLDYTIGGTPHRIGSRGIAWMPSNVMHGMLNESKETALGLEFQPVRRSEWLPPHTPVPPYPQSAEPMPLPPGRPVTLDYDLASGGWRTMRNGARTKALTGEKIQASFWDLTAATAAVDLTESPSPHERFVWVLSGRARVVHGSARREVNTHTLMVLAPAARNVTMKSLGGGATAILVFEFVAASH
jgi:quercetin dioxygenase-like cupin family protein